MKQQKAELNFLLIFLLGVFVLTFFIFQPFVYSLVLALVFATVFAPIHDKIFILTRNRSALAALLATFSVLLAVVVPLAFLGVQVLDQATHLYASLANNGGATDLSLRLEKAVQGLAGFSPVPLEFDINIDQYAKQGLNWVLQNFGSFFANVASAIAGVFIFLIALYYLFKDGHKLKKFVLALSPLSNVHDETIINKLTLAINSSIRGSLVVSLTQGVLTAIGFAIFGVPSAVLWGGVATITALIPGVGTAIVFLPAILYLFFSGQALMAGLLLLWGVIAVGLVDNFLGPKLVEKGMQLHPFLILLAILGGLSLFGPLGFLLGPLVISLLFALIEIYFVLSKDRQAR